MNNSVLPTLFDDNQLPQEQSEQGIFDFEQIPEEKRPFVLQKTAETQWLLKRSSDDIFKIGKNLLEVKGMLPHSMYEKWVETQFPLSLRTAQKFTQIARNIGSKSAGPALLSGCNMEYLIDLASAPEDFIDQALISDVPPSKEEIKQAKLQAKLDKEARARAEAEKLAMQTQLFDLQENRQTEIDTLTQQYDTKVLKITEQYNTVIQQLKDEMQELEENATPKIEFIEVPKEVLPLSVKNNLESLQNRVNELTASVEAEKKTIPPEAQKQMEDLQAEAKRQTEALQKQLDKLKEDRRLLDETNKANQARIDKLNSELKVAIKNRITSENDERIRQEWRSITSEARSCMMRLLGSWPTSLDINSFESDDWERLSQLKTTLKRVLEECDNLNYGGDDMIVNDHEVEAPIAFIESKPQQPVTTTVDPAKLFEQYRDFVKSLANDTLWWRAPDSGIMDMEMDKNTHITYTSELLKSGDGYRMQAAIEGMQRTLGILK